MSGLDISEAHSPNITFAEAARAAEEAARTAEGEQEPLAEEPAAPVVEEPAAPVEAAAEDSAPVESTAAEALLAGRFKTVEELERGYTEMLTVLNRQGAEVGELRRAYDERLAEIERRQIEPTPQRVTVTPELIDTNPAYAVQVAYDQGDQATLHVAYQQWTAMDETSANIWRVETAAAEREAALEARTAERFRELEGKITPVVEGNELSVVSQGFQAFPAEAKAFLASESPELDRLGAEYPLIARAVVEGSPQEKLDAMRALYEIHRGRTADNLAVSTEEVARQTAVEAQTARDEAHVASVTAASQEEPKSREQIEQEAAVAAFTRRRGVWDDAFVRPGQK